MPIDVEQFGVDPEDLPDDGGAIGASRVLSFLRSNPDRAFTAGEIQAEIGSGPSLRSAETMGVSAVLSGLEAEDLVRRHAGYGALAATGHERALRPRVVYEGPDGPVRRHVPASGSTPSSSSETVRRPAVCRESNVRPYGSSRCESPNSCQR